MSPHLRRNLKRTGIALLAILLVLIGIIAGTATWLLGTASGGRWLFGQVPGLTVSGFEGRLGGQWQAQRLEWRSEGTRAILDDLSMQWSSACLLEREVCLQELRIAAAEIQTTPEDPAGPEGESQSEPISLPEIDLPVTITVDQLSLGRLTLNDTLLLQDLDLAATLTGSELAIESLSLAREDLQLQAAGELVMSGDWPVDIRADYRMQLMETEELEARLTAQGRIARNVHLDAEVDGYVEGSLSGMVQPLVPGLPAELTAKPTRLPIPDAVPPTLRPENLELAAVGNLDEGWSVEASAQLPAEEGPIPLEITGHVTTSDARIDQLALIADEERSLRVEGSLDWSEEFAAQANLSWRDFPWERLLPETGPLPVSLQTLDAQVSYAGDTYNGQVDAEFSGPAGPSRLSTPFRGDLEQITLPELTLQAGPGGIVGSVAVGFADTLEWYADLTVQDLNPGYWVEALPGELSGSVQSEGQLTDAGPELNANIALDGRLREQEAQVSIDAQASGNQWQADPLLVRLGENRITGRASQADELSAYLELNMPRLSQLWPGLAGTLTGTVQASGWPEALEARADLAGSGLGYNDMSLEALNLDASIEGDAIDLEATIEGIEGAEQRIEEVRLDGSGTLAQHQLRIRGEEARGSIDLTFNGGSETLSLPPADAPSTAEGTDPAALWRGTLSEGAIRFAEQNWQLQSPAPLVYQEDGVAGLGAHCWAWEDASLCAEDQRLWPEPRIRLALENLPTDIISPFLPPDVRWQSTISSQVAVDMDDNGPRGQITLDAGPGEFSVLEAPEIEEDDAEANWIDYSYDTLALEADLTPARVNVDLRLAGPALGEFEAQATVDDPNGDPRPMSGSFTLESLDLGMLRPFAQVEELSGTLSGKGEIGGTLTDPTVAGRIDLDNGELADERLPLRFDDFNLQVQFTETGADIEGGWRSGEDGRGRIAGEAGWGGELSADIRITGEELPVRLEPYANLEVAPDLRVRYSGQQPSISGQVAIPRGAIEIRELPPQAVEVSGDAVIVGEEPEEEVEEAGEDGPSPVEGLSMQLDVIVGEDELTFDGFGVTGELVGRLRIGDNLDTRGELSLENGQYEIYGQQLELREANLLFAGPISQPFLEIEAVREVNDVTAGIRLTGAADSPETEIFSEPSMSEEQALSYLVLGRPLQSEQDSNVVGTAALSMGLNQAAPVTRAIGERVGVEDLQLGAEGSGDEQRIVASGYITDKLSVRYGVSLFDTANELALRYDLSRQLYLEAASGLASSLDIFYSRDF